jgi:hypothetical protein
MYGYFPYNLYFELIRIFIAFNGGVVEGARGSGGRCIGKGDR